ncbi:MICOS complex subunit MIC25 [Camelus dromedarius]|uniref:MICOS complex subunit MIC25 n=1 Tax=Camelus dromedarius TaxID=9838 RepID=A0A5N4CZ45_CAMDR|nr:MICOS complex subunit MIC25 [Camelus dromedarius]
MEEGFDYRIFIGNRSEESQALSESVVHRMKDSSQPSGAGPPPPALGAARGPETDSDLPRPEQGGRQHSGAELEPLTRSQQEPAAVQDKLLQVATREKGAAAKPCSASLPQAEGFEDQEKQAAGLAVVDDHVFTQAAG